MVGLRPLPKLPNATLVATVAIADTERPPRSLLVCIKTMRRMILTSQMTMILRMAIATTLSKMTWMTTIPSKMILT